MSLFEASRYVARIELIDLAALRDAGVRFLLIDRDNTCMARSTMRVEAPVCAWFEQAHALGFSTCLVSNNFHGKDVEETAGTLGSSVVHHAMKPAPFALTHALAREGFAASEAVLIGDQIFTDVVAGNLAHIPVILVHPLSTADLWYTQILRLIERPLLKGHIFEGDR